MAERRCVARWWRRCRDLRLLVAGISQLLNKHILTSLGPLVMAETGWLIDRQLGPSADAAPSKSAAAGEIRVEPLSAADWTRIAALTIQYADQHLGGIDSSLAAVAERLGATSIGTARLGSVFQ